MVHRKKDHRNEFLVRSSVSHSLAIVEAMGIATEKSHDELTPLGEVIDPDALDKIVTGSKAEAKVSFEYEGRTVTVSENLIKIAEPTKRR